MAGAGLPQPDMTDSPQIPGSARLVVIGAGIAGCSAVYHLAQLGWRDIAVIDQGPLFETGGSTSHAPGGVFQTNFSRMMTEFARCTVGLYNALELDGEPCFHPVGGLEVAATPERWHDLKRKAGTAKSWGVEAELISPAEARGLVPILDERRSTAPTTSPGTASQKRCGPPRPWPGPSADAAAFFGRTEVTGIEVADGRVRAVLTSRGRIATGTVLVCAGIWGPRIGRMAGVEIPLAPVQHQYAVSAPLPELAGETREVVHPVLRHQDRAMYFRQHADCYGIGSYQHEPLPVRPGELPGYDEKPPDPAVMEFTPGHFEAAHADAVELLPALRGAPLASGINGIFSFTPDGMPLIGPLSGRARLLGRRGDLDHPRRRGRQGGGGVDDHRRPGSRPARGGPQPLPRPCADSGVRRGARGAAVPRGVRHHPPPAAAGEPARPAPEPLPPAAAGARRRLLRKRRLGGAAVVRGERQAPARPVAGAVRLGGPRLVADPGSRAQGRPGAGGALRPDAAGEDRGARSQGRFVSAVPHLQPGRPAARDGGVHPDAERGPGASGATWSSPA